MVITSVHKVASVDRLFNIDLLVMSILSLVIAYYIWYTQNHL